MFSILGFLGGLFSGVGGAIKGWFYKKTADEIVASIDKNVERVIPIAQDAIRTTGELASSVSTVTTNIAEVAKSDNEVAIEMHKQLAEESGSWLSNNVRPIGFLVSFGILIAQLFGYIPPNDWPLMICLSYMGARTVDKLGQVFSAASALKTIIASKK